MMKKGPFSASLPIFKTNFCAHAFNFNKIKSLRPISDIYCRHILRDFNSCSNLICNNLAHFLNLYRPSKTVKKELKIGLSHYCFTLNSNKYIFRTSKNQNILVTYPKVCYIKTTRWFVPVGSKNVGFAVRTFDVVATRISLKSNYQIMF